MERAPGIEPGSKPWQGLVVPLNHARKLEVHLGWREAAPTFYVNREPILRLATLLVSQVYVGPITQLTVLPARLGD